MVSFEENFALLRQELDSSVKPLFLYDDDPDGLSSFLLFYRHLKRGKGIMVKSTPHITDEYLRKVEEFGPDKVFILDLAMVDQSFIDKCRVKVVWIDHHIPLERQNLVYFNPRVYQPELYFPVSQIAYNVVKSDVWIATTGAVGDFSVPSYLNDFKRDFPGYVGKQTTPETLLFKTKLGRLVNVFSLVLKGPTNKVMQCIKVLTRIEHPDEILNQTTSQGRFVYKYYETNRYAYDKLLQSALKEKKRDRLFVFVYPSDKLSLTSDLALELIYRFPKKIVVVAREKGDEMKISLRSRGVPVSGALAKALQGISGVGGGHENACGATVKVTDFEKFISQLRASLPEQ